jgi:hypothetical protein
MKVLIKFVFDVTFSVFVIYANIDIHLLLFVASTSHPGCVSPHLVVRRRFLRQSHRRESAPPPTELEVR